MEIPSKEILNSGMSSEVIKPVPRPFSIEALMSDTGPKRTNQTWNPAASVHAYHQQITRDTDSEGSLDLDLAQDLSRHSQKDGEFMTI